LIVGKLGLEQGERKLNGEMSNLEKRARKKGQNQNQNQNPPKSNTHPQPTLTSSPISGFRNPRNGASSARTPSVMQRSTSPNGNILVVSLPKPPKKQEKRRRERGGEKKRKDF
jgi:hypothetical protein